MAFRLKKGESVEASVQRIAREQIDKALDEARSAELDRHEAVHQVRKRCKKLRGLLRLARSGLGSYGFENAWYRDSARPLSSVRDAQSILETLGALGERFEGALEDGSFDAVRRALVERRDEVVADEVDLDRRLDEFAARMREGHERVGAWRVEGDGFGAVRAGLVKTYARAREAMRAAYDEPSIERFHEWRKRVKYHRYHARLLRALWKKPLEARRDEAEELSNLLGDDHDLSVLRDALRADPGALGGEAAVRTLLGLGVRRQRELRAAAGPLGARLFAEKPKRFAKRLEAYWSAWRDGVDVERRLVHEPHPATE